MERLIIIVIVVAFIAYRLYTTRDSKVQRPYSVPTTVDRSLPDLPISFGYKTAWFAVKSENIRKVAESLKLKNISPSNWLVGLDRAYVGAVFLTPAIDGWTLAIGRALPRGDTQESFEEVITILQTLSKEFGEAQFFCTHRIVEYHCWIKATDGRIERIYSYVGESGENLVVEGNPTPFEQSLNLGNSLSEAAKNEKYFERKDILWPNEDTVMQVAEHWSVNPAKLSDRKDLPAGLGLLGEYL